MKSYLSIVSAQFRMLLQYRAAAVAGFGTQLFWGLIRVMIFEAFYYGSKVGQPMVLSDVVTYVWLGQAFFAMLPFRPNVEVGTMIREGTIAFEMLRPLNIYKLWFSRALAERSAPTVLRATPMLVLAGLFLNLQAPANPRALLLFVISTLLAFLLSCAISTLISISLLWTLSGEGIPPLSTAMVFVFSGIIVPLPLFPESLRIVVNFLPFRGIVDTPFRLYLDHMSAAEAMGAFFHQAVWIVILVGTGRWILSRGLKRLVVQGG
ncbi:MAG: hypothetical protein GY866_06490 [Proteobacteria bacterium]|nr:hypothetical protein [Pseudomonadota bacterium]